MTNVKFGGKYVSFSLSGSSWREKSVTYVTKHNKHGTLITAKLLLAIINNEVENLIHLFRVRKEMTLSFLESENGSFWKFLQLRLTRSWKNWF